MDDIIVQEYPQGTAWVHRQRAARIRCALEAGDTPHGRPPAGAAASARYSLTFRE